MNSTLRSLFLVALALSISTASTQAASSEGRSPENQSVVTERLSFFDKQRVAYAESPFGLGVQLGLSSTTFKESAGLKSQQETKLSIPIGLSFDWRATRYFGFQSDLSYSSQTLGTESGSNSGGYFASDAGQSGGSPQLERFSGGVSALAYPLANGLYAGTKISWVHYSLGWNSSSYIPEFHTSANALSWGPVLGYELMIPKARLSLGAVGSYLFAPQVSFPDRLGGNTIAIPESSDLRFLATAKVWF